MRAVFAAMCVWFADRAPSSYFYWDDIPGRWLRLSRVDAETALEAAKAIARTERERLG
jgi:hypothetical protein